MRGVYQRISPIDVILPADRQGERCADQFKARQFGIKEEAISEDSTQWLKESLEPFELVHRGLRQYQEHDHAGPMENETGKQTLRTLSGHGVADSQEK